MRYRFFQYRLEIQSDAGDQLEQIIFPPNTRLDPNANGALVLTNGNGSTYTLPSRRQTTAIIDSTGASVAIAATDILFQQQIAALLEAMQINTATTGSGSTLVPNLYLENGINRDVATDNPGDTYTALFSEPCRVVSILNTASGAVDIEVAYDPVSSLVSGVIIPAGSFYNFPVTSDAGSIRIRRADLSPTSVTVRYMVFSPSTT